MADNRSLDEFTGADEPGDSAPAAAEAVEPAAGGGEPVDAAGTEHDAAPAAATADPEDPIEPMAETFAWSGAAGECASCGEAVEERWRDGDVLVCGECKAW